MFQLEREFGRVLDNQSTFHFCIFWCCSRRVLFLTRRGEKQPHFFFSGLRQKSFRSCTGNAFKMLDTWVCLRPLGDRTLSDAIGLNSTWLSSVTWPGSCRVSPCDLQWSVNRSNLSEVCEVLRFRQHLRLRKDSTMSPRVFPRGRPSLASNWSWRDRGCHCLSSSVNQGSCITLARCGTSQTWACSAPLGTPSAYHPVSAVRTALPCVREKEKTRQPLLSLQCPAQCTPLGEIWLKRVWGFFFCSVQIGKDISLMGHNLSCFQGWNVSSFPCSLRLRLRRTYWQIGFCEQIGGYQKKGKYYQLWRLSIVASLEIPRHSEQQSELRTRSKKTTCYFFWLATVGWIILYLAQVSCHARIAVIIYS